MLNIDEIGDYRDLLKNYFAERKLEFSLYSYKMMGQKLGLETSQMYRILNKELHLPNRSIPFAKDLLGLKGRSGELFEILVAASKTKSQAKKDKLYRMAIALKDVKMRAINIKLTCHAPVEGVAPVLAFSNTVPERVKVGESVAISVEATDEDGTISHIDFLDNDSLVHSEWTYPYEFDWKLTSEGAHTLKAIAYDNDGNTVEKTISVVAESLASLNAFGKMKANALEIQEFKIYDMQGNLVGTMKSSAADLQNRMRKNGLPGGMYIVRGDGRFSMKIFKAK